jgi:hypothetical protein
MWSADGKVIGMGLPKPIDPHITPMLQMLDMELHNIMFSLLC